MLGNSSMIGDCTRVPNVLATQRGIDTGQTAVGQERKPGAHTRISIVKNLAITCSIALITVAQSPRKKQRKLTRTMLRVQERT